MEGTNSKRNPHMTLSPGIELEHIGGRRALSTLSHPGVFIPQWEPVCRGKTQEQAEELSSIAHAHVTERFCKLFSETCTYACAVGTRLPYNVELRRVLKFVNILLLEIQETWPTRVFLALKL